MSDKKSEQKKENRRAPFAQTPSSWPSLSGPSGIRAASFDVFDTLLTRTLGSFESVFLIQGKILWERGFTRCLPYVFMQERLEAERRARKNSPHAEVTLDDIYRELSFSMGLSQQMKNEYTMCEAELESRMIVPVPGMLDIVDRARAAFGSVNFVSDMYLSEDFIRNQLIRHGFYREGDRLLVSCESRKTKRRGDLFKELLAQVRLEPSSVVHVGNHYDSDYRIPRNAGFQVEWFRSGNLNIYEELLAGHSAETGAVASLFAGASRLARHEAVLPRDRDRVLYETGCSVAGPVLSSFVLWVLARCRDLRIRRIYFIARDGQILKKIADVLIEKLGLDIEARYLYGSRQAWHGTAVREWNREKLSWLLEKTTFLSVRNFLARLGLAPEDFEGVLADAGFPAGAWDDNLSEARREVLFSACLGSPAIEEACKKSANEQQGIVLDYFRQEGLLSGTPYGVVDLGWHGRMLDSMHRIIGDHDASHVPARGFYFGLMGGELSGLPKKAFFLDKRQGLGQLKALQGLEQLMESFCSADHGLTLGYERRGGEILPRLQEPVNEKLMSWGLSRVHEGVLAFARNLNFESDFFNWDQNLREAVRDVLCQFWNTPDPLQARYWGSFPFEDDQIGGGHKALAKPYGLKDVLKVLLTGHLPYHHRVAWVSGSYEMSNRTVKMLMRIAFNLRAIASKVRAIASWGKKTCRKNPFNNMRVR